jgi:peptide/nickel transport system substrate-binding protein
VIAAVIVVGGAIAAIRIGTRSNRGREPVVEAQRPRAGGTLRVAIDEDFNSLDPQRSGSPGSWFVARALHRGLMAFPNRPYPAGGRPVPDLAQSYSVNASGTRYTFRLRAARFGAPANRPVRGPDVRAGLLRLLAADSSVGRALRAVIRRIAASPSTVVIDLSRPANDLTSLLALPQASAVPAELRVRTRVAPTSFAPAGPYSIVQYLPERRLLLERNEAWSRASDPVRAAWVDRIDVTIGVAPARQRTQISSGETDLSFDLRVGPQGGPPHPDGCLRYLWLNTSVDPFRSARIRRAVALAVNRSAVAATYPSREAVSAGRMLPPTVFGSVTGAPPPRAREAAGLVRGERVAATLVVGNDPLSASQAGAVARAAAAAGIRLSVQRVPISSLYSDYYELPARRVAAGIATWCADWPGLGGRGVLAPLLDHREIRSSGNTVYSMLRSPSLSRLIDRAAAARSEPAATALWTQADRYAVRLAAVIPLAWLRRSVVTASRVGGPVQHPFFTAGDPAGLWLPL